MFGPFLSQVWMQATLKIHVHVCRLWVLSLMTWAQFHGTAYHRILYLQSHVKRTNLWVASAKFCGKQSREFGPWCGLVCNRKSYMSIVRLLLVSCLELDIWDIWCMQAWYLTEATASVSHGLCLGALSKVPIETYKFLIEVPFAMEKIALPLQVQSIRPVHVHVHVCTCILIICSESLRSLDTYMYSTCRPL